MKIHRMLFSLPVFALLVAMLPSIPARADDAADLLAKHKAYVGFTFGDGTIQTLTTTDARTLDKDNSVLGTTETKDLGILFRSDVTDLARKSTSSTGFTGNIFWRSNENGITVPLIGDPAKLIFAENLFYTDAISAEAWTVGDTVQIDGGSYRIVHVTPPSALPIDLYVDPATGAFKRAVFDPGGDYEMTLNVLAYADALPGKKIVSKWKFEGSSATHAYTHILANASVMGEDLHPPAQTATWTFANAQPFPIKITDTRLIVKAKFNGVEGTFIMDTGAAGFFMSDDFAQRAKIKELAHSEAQGIAGTLKVRIGRADTFEVGGNTLANPIVTYGGKGIDQDAPDGLLGFDMLGAAFVTLDLVNSTLQFQDPATVDPDTIPGIHVAVDLSSGQPVVPVKVNGTADLNALLDSGAPGPVLLPSDYISKNHLRMLIDDSIQGYFASHVTMGGVSGGYESDECGRVDTIALGPIVYQSPGACKSQSFTGDNGLVGFDFLKNFAQISFDYQHSGMIFVAKQ
jgi:hypothetical protein